MREIENIRIVRKNLWSRGFHVRLPVPENTEFDLVVEGLKVKVFEKVPSDFEGCDVVAIVEKGTGSFKGKNMITYYGESIKTSNPADLFAKIKIKK